MHSCRTSFSKSVLRPTGVGQSCTATVSCSGPKGRCITTLGRLAHLIGDLLDLPIFEAGPLCSRVHVHVPVPLAHAASKSMVAVHTKAARLKVGLWQSPVQLAAALIHVGSSLEVSIRSQLLASSCQPTRNACSVLRHVLDPLSLSGSGTLSGVYCLLCSFLMLVAGLLPTARHRSAVTSRWASIPRGPVPSSPPICGG